ELENSLKKNKILVRKRKSTNISIQSNHQSTALYCNAKVKDMTIPLIINSGSSGSVVSSYLLKKIKIKVERPSPVNMVNVHGESKRAIREILNFPFEVGGYLIPIDVLVTDAHNYQAIVGNYWLSIIKANIDWSQSETSLLW